MKRAFAPVELLAPLGITLIVVGIIVSSIWKSRTNSVREMIFDDLRALEEAGKKFFEEYEVWPTLYPDDWDDARYGKKILNREVINALRAVDGPGNEGHEMNKNQIVFLEVEPYEEGLSGLDENGNFLDAWGQPYHIVLDANLDGKCVVEKSIHGTITGEGIVIWSCGRDREPDTRDDRRSWKLPKK